MKNGVVGNMDDRGKYQIESMQSAFNDLRAFSASASISSKISANSSSKKKPAKKVDPEVERIRGVYAEWCVKHEKTFSEERLRVFSENLMQVEKYQKETGKVLKLNEHSDLTQAEYNSKFNTSWSPPKNTISKDATSSAASASSSEAKNEGGIPERVISAYKEWCSHFGKDFDEKRLPIFQKNFLQVEEYYKSTGIAIKINEFADLSPEEFEKAKAEDGAKDSTKASQDATLKTAESLLQAERKRKAEEAKPNKTDVYDARMKEEAAKRQRKEEARLEAEEAKRKAAEEDDRVKAEIDARIEAKHKFEEAEEAKLKTSEASVVDEKAAKLKEHFRNTYKEYCEYYHKEFDESRIPIFKSSIIEINRQLMTTGKRIELDAYADLTPEEATARRKAVQDARAQVEQDTSKWAKEEARLLHAEYDSRKAAAEARIRAEEAARIQAEQETARIRAEQEARIRAEEEAQRLAELAAAEARKQAEEEARRRAEEAARIKAEQEAARIRAELEATKKAEQEAKHLAEVAAAQARQQAEEEARHRVEELSRMQAEEEAARVQAEQEARRRAEEEVTRLAEVAATEALNRAEEEAARLHAEQEAARIAAEQTQRKTAEGNRLFELETQLRAEAEARRKAEEEAKRLAEENSRIKAAEQARQHARDQAELGARANAELEASRMTEEQARVEAQEQARLFAQDGAIRAAEEKTRIQDEHATSVNGAAAMQNVDVPSAQPKTQNPSTSGLWSFFQPKKKQSRESANVAMNDSTAGVEEMSEPNINTGVPEKVRKAYEKWAEFYNRPFEESRLPVFHSNLIQVEEYFKNSGSPVKIDVCENPAKLNKHADRTIEEYKEIQAAAAASQTASPPVRPKTSGGSSPLMTVSDGAGTGPKFPSGGSYVANMNGMSSGDAAPNDATSRLSSIPEDQLNDLSGLAGSTQHGVTNREQSPDKIRRAYEQWCQMNNKAFEESRVSIFEENFLQVERYYKSPDAPEKLTDIEILGKLNVHADRTVEEYKQMQAASGTSSPPAPVRPKKSGAASLMTVSDGGGGPGPSFPSGGSYVAKLKGISPTDAAQSTAGSRLSSIPEDQLNNLFEITGESRSQEETKDEGPEIPDKVRIAYKKWCEYYDKSFDESRLSVFQSNLVQVEKYFKNSNFPIEINVYESPEKLNKNADRTIAEYKQIKASASEPPPDNAINHESAIPVSSGPSGASDLDRARLSYTAWCKQFNKQFDENRLKVFAKNLKIKEKYEIESGETVELNKFSDLTPEEFSKMKASESSAAGGSRLAGGSGSGGSAPLMTVSDGVGTGPSFPSGGSYMAKMRGETTLETPGYDESFAEPPIELGYPGKSSNENGPDRLQNAYQMWCKINNKPFDESRMSVFEGNFLQVERYYKSAKGVQQLSDSELAGKLNEHADRTIEEYQQIQAAAAASAPPPGSNGRAKTGGASLITVSDGGGGPGPQFPSGGSYVAKMKGVTSNPMSSNLGGRPSEGSSLPEEQLNDLSAIVSGVAPFLRDDEPGNMPMGVGSPEIVPRSYPVSNPAPPIKSNLSVPPETFTNRPEELTPRPKVPSATPDRSSAPVTVSVGKASDNIGTDIRVVYKKWCEVYSKEFEESRVEIFEATLLQLEKFYESTGKQINLRENVSKLNEYADRTKEEHREIQDLKMASVAQVHDDAKKDQGKVPKPTKGAIAKAVATPRNQAIPENIRSAYKEWCSFYKKDFEEARLPIFHANFIQVQKYYKSAGKPFENESIVKLNEYADRTKEEHNKIKASKMATVATPSNDGKKKPSTMAKSKKSAEPSSTAPKSQQEIPDVMRTAYREWCSFYKKEYEEARLPIFQSNFRQVEEYYKAKGDPIELNRDGNIVKLNEHADRTVEEHKQIMASASTPQPVTTKALVQHPPRRESEVDRLRKRFSQSMQRPADVARINAEKQAKEASIKRMEHKRRLEQEAKLKAEEDVKLKAEQKRKAEEDAKLKAEQKLKAEVEAKLKADEQKRKAEAEAKLKAEQKLKAEVEAKLKADEQKRKAEAEAKLKAEQKLKAEVEAKLKANEQKRKVQAEAKLKADEQKRKAEEEAAEKTKADEKAKLKVAAEHGLKMEKDAKLKTEQKAATLKAEAKQKLKVDEKAKSKAGATQKPKSGEAAKFKTEVNDSLKPKDGDAQRAKLDTRLKRLLDEKDEARLIAEEEARRRIKRAAFQAKKGTEVNSSGTSDIQKEKERLFKAVEEVQRKADLERKHEREQEVHNAKSMSQGKDSRDDPKEGSSGRGLSAKGPVDREKGVETIEAGDTVTKSRTENGSNEGIQIGSEKLEKKSRGKKPTEKNVNGTTAAKSEQSKKQSGLDESNRKGILDPTEGKMSTADRKKTAESNEDAEEAIKMEIEEAVFGGKSKTRQSKGKKKIVLINNAKKADHAKSEAQKKGTASKNAKKVELNGKESEHVVTKVVEVKGLSTNATLSENATSDSSKDATDHAVGKNSQFSLFDSIKNIWGNH